VSPSPTYDIDAQLGAFALETAPAIILLNHLIPRVEGDAVDVDDVMDILAQFAIDLGYFPPLTIEFDGFTVAPKSVSNGQIFKAMFGTGTFDNYTGSIKKTDLVKKLTPNLHNARMKALVPGITAAAWHAEQLEIMETTTITAAMVALLEYLKTPEAESIQITVSGSLNMNTTLGVAKDFAKDMYNAQIDSIIDTVDNETSALSKGITYKLGLIAMWAALSMNPYKSAIPTNTALAGMSITDMDGFYGDTVVSMLPFYFTFKEMNETRNFHIDLQTTLSNQTKALFADADGDTYTMMLEFYAPGCYTKNLCDVHADNLTNTFLPYFNRAASEIMYGDDTHRKAYENQQQMSREMHGFFNGDDAAEYKKFLPAIEEATMGSLVGVVSFPTLRDLWIESLDIALSDDPACIPGFKCGGQEYRECGSYCPCSSSYNYQDNVTVKEVCAAVCVTGYQCKEGFSFDSDNGTCKACKFFDVPPFVTSTATTVTSTTDTISTYINTSTSTTAVELDCQGEEAQVCATECPPCIADPLGTTTSGESCLTCMPCTVYFACTTTTTTTTTTTSTPVPFVTTDVAPLCNGNLDAAFCSDSQLCNSKIVGQVMQEKCPNLCNSCIDGTLSPSTSGNTSTSSSSSTPTTTTTTSTTSTSSWTATTITTTTASTASTTTTTTTITTITASTTTTTSKTTPAPTPLPTPVPTSVPTTVPTPTPTPTPTPEPTSVPTPAPVVVCGEGMYIDSFCTEAIGPIIRAACPELCGAPQTPVPTPTPTEPDYGMFECPFECKQPRGGPLPCQDVQGGVAGVTPGQCYSPGSFTGAYSKCFW
jgi:hypothetical protein